MEYKIHLVLGGISEQIIDENSSLVSCLFATREKIKQKQYIYIYKYRERAKDGSIGVAD